MMIIVLAPVTQWNWSHFQILLQQLLLQKMTSATNWGLMFLPDYSKHFKKTDQRRGKAAVWMLKLLSETQ